MRGKTAVPALPPANHRSRSMSVAKVVTDDEGNVQEGRVNLRVSFLVQ